MAPGNLKTILDDHEKWVRGDAGKRANLEGANLRGANLRGAYLGGAHLRDANLEGAHLEGAYLRGANLEDANLGGAYLRGAYLRGANLEDANLEDAYLGGAYLRDAYLRDAYLRDANLEGAHLEGAYLGGDRKITGLIARVTRVIDPCEFFAWRTDKGDFIKAGCRFMTVDEFSAHVAAAYSGTPKAEETLAILDFIESRFKAVKP